MGDNGKRAGESTNRFWVRGESLVVIWSLYGEVNKRNDRSTDDGTRPTVRKQPHTERLRNPVSGRVAKTRNKA
jgi:hypothetical protein